MITVNGDDITTLDVTDLRGRIGVVSQSIFLFRGTVLDNILYGQDRAGRSDVEELVAQLGLRGFIDRLAAGLDTRITQSGSSVSGGQAQIIALIRALLSNRDIILLDEPIANVDAEARDAVIAALRTRHLGGMQIVISHQTEGLEFLSRRIRI